MNNKYEVRKWWKNGVKFIPVGNNGLYRKYNSRTCAIGKLKKKNIVS